MGVREPADGLGFGVKIWSWFRADGVSVFNASGLAC